VETRPKRFLLVEDDETRKEIMERWLPAGDRIVWARNAGQAMGLVRRDRGRAYTGILLDHDLERQPYTTGSQFSGTEVAEQIIAGVARDTPILVHSMNFSEGDTMAERLSRAGFSVTRIPMRDLDQTSFLAWIDEAGEGWE
jgi:CheY-like chemotaxis protein